MGGIARFTTAEREHLALFDAMIDAAPMRHADYKQVEFDDTLCLTRLEKRKEHVRQKYARQKADKIKAGTWQQLCDKQAQYYVNNKERIAKRKAEFYQANKERISAAQRDYRQRRAIALAAAMA